MRILFLLKRQYMGRDLIEDRFWKFWELPRGLASLGHSTFCSCLSYKREEEFDFCEKFTAESGGRLCISSCNLGRSIFLGVWRFLSRSYKRAVESDIIVAASDSLYAIFAMWLSLLTGRPFVIEIFDNFDGFASARIWGVKRLYSLALRKASGICVYSHSMKTFLEENYPDFRRITVIESGINKEQFRPIDKESARKSLGLPAASTLVGFAGALSVSKDSFTLVWAMEELLADSPDIEFVVAGPLADDVRRHLPSKTRLLDPLQHEEVPFLYSALDLAVVTYGRTLNGATAFPTRLMEAISCGTPVVCANVGDCPRILQNSMDVLYQPGDIASLLKALRFQLSEKKSLSYAFHSWEEYSEEFEKFLYESISK